MTVKPSELAQLCLHVPVMNKWRYGDQFDAPRDYAHLGFKANKHEGIDFFPADARRPLFARPIYPGVVTFAGWNPHGYGNLIKVLSNHNGVAFTAWYAHLAEMYVRQGEDVPGCYVLGLVGAEGNTGGAVHLHLTWEVPGFGHDGYTVADVLDPLPYFAPCG